MPRFCLNMYLRWDAALYLEIYILLTVIWAMTKGLNMLGFLSHLLQCCHPACGHEGSSHLFPVLPYEFLSPCKLSTLTPRQIMVEIASYSPSHARTLVMPCFSGVALTKKFTSENMSTRGLFRNPAMPGGDDTRKRNCSLCSVWH